MPTGSKQDLVVQLPPKFSTIPRFQLLFPHPSPIQSLPRISAALGGKVDVYAKREDCNSGVAFGGNKTRKLEFLVADALEKGCDTLVSIGGVQSNHTRQVAGAAAAAGLKVGLIDPSRKQCLAGTASLQEQVSSCRVCSLSTKQVLCVVTNSQPQI